MSDLEDECARLRGYWLEAQAHVNRLRAENERMANALREIVAINLLPVHNGMVVAIKRIGAIANSALAGGERAGDQP